MEIMTWATFYKLWPPKKYNDRLADFPAICKAFTCCSFNAYKKASLKTRRKVNTFVGWDGLYQSDENIESPKNCC